MIIVYLQGGIGNQMFQYAAGRRLACCRGVPLKLDLSRLAAGYPGVTPRCYALDPFAIAAEPAQPSESAALYQPAPRRLGRLFQALRPAARRSHIRQHGFGFDPATLRLTDNVILDGYWQSEQYFADVAQLIRSDFGFRNEATGRNLELAALIAGCDAVSVHIRRGDYLSDARAAVKYAACPRDYYLTGAALAAGRLANPHFFVFSDDAQWVREHFTLPYQMTLVDHNGPDQAHEDLRLMSLCRHHIIANSSFSWWGAWLDPRPDKTVIAPQRWFNDPAVDTSHLLPAAWLRLPQ